MTSTESKLWLESFFECFKFAWILSAQKNLDTTEALNFMLKQIERNILLPRELLEDLSVDGSVPSRTLEKVQDLFLSDLAPRALGFVLSSSPNLFGTYVIMLRNICKTIGFSLENIISVDNYDADIFHVNCMLKYIDFYVKLARICSRFLLFFGGVISKLPTCDFTSDESPKELFNDFFTLFRNLTNAFVCPTPMHDSLLRYYYNCASFKF